jgi:hypothetical protein
VQAVAKLRESTDTVTLVLEPHVAGAPLNNDAGGSVSDPAKLYGKTLLAQVDYERCRIIHPFTAGDRLHVLASEPAFQQAPWPWLA